METPSEEHTATPGETQPAFDGLDKPADVVQSGRTRDEIYSTALQLHEAATVADIAERSGVGPDATREYLRWFEDMGVVRKVSDSPAQYVVNRAYLDWRRANRLSERFREAELVAHLQDVTATIDDYREEYGADSPNDLTVTEIADARGDPVEAVWEDISDWETAVKRRDVLDMALQMRRQRTTGAGQQWQRSKDEVERQADL